MLGARTAAASSRLWRALRVSLGSVRLVSAGFAWLNLDEGVRIEVVESAPRPSLVVERRTVRPL